jgi:hypothetical protein
MFLPITPSVAFDLMFLDGKDLRTLSIEERRGALRRVAYLARRNRAYGSARQSRQRSRHVVFVIKTRASLIYWGCLNRNASAVTPGPITPPVTSPNTNSGVVIVNSYILRAIPCRDGRDFLFGA